MDELAQRLQHAVDLAGLDFYGLADLAPAYDAILDQGGPDIAAFPRAVSIGIALLHPIVDRLPNRADRAAALEYHHHVYTVVNARLDAAASWLASVLQRTGYQAMSIPASNRVDSARLYGSFSHKLAAHLAGHGWIGKSCLLVTPQYGPRVRWATVLTDAPLAPAAGPPAERCGDCRRCVDICPAHAFTGRAFVAGEPREARFDATRCDRYYQDMREQNAGVGVCGLCVYVCPHGRTWPGRGNTTAEVQ